MSMTAVDSPLARMVEATPTDYWNDSCAVAELEYAVARGGTGATSNPVIVGEVMKKEKDHWVPRVRELAAANPTWSEVELTWALIEEMGQRGAAILEPVFEVHGGRKGRLSLQTNPADYRTPDRMTEQAVRFSRLAPNVQVKFPCTAEGLQAAEDATAAGVVVNITVVFTVAQCIAAAEAVERGLRRAEANGIDTSAFSPVCSLMVGRLDDWTKVLVERDSIALDPDAANWAGIAAFKRAYGIYRERGYRTRLLAAAYRHRLHWTELVGGDVVLTMPHAWQARFNASGITPAPRIDVPVDQRLIDDLLARVPDFRRAYEPDGLAPAEFVAFGATARTLRSFVEGYHTLIGTVRDIVLPNPDVRPA
ncbi:MAG TPA: transaldolase family protein [Candidatus Limnocylindrales bacterium]|nr:transaldolase family protein [Candidatus Limnocylindrales bacterium]